MLAVRPEGARRTMCLCEVRWVSAAIGQRSVLLRKRHLRGMRGVPLVWQALGRWGLLQALWGTAQRRRGSAEQLRIPGALRCLRRADRVGPDHLFGVHGTGAVVAVAWLAL